GWKLKLRELKAAVGDALSVAVVGKEAVAFAKPHDEAKLGDFAAQFDKGHDHYTVQHIGDWSVVADSQDVFAAVRAAHSGKSLADDASFQAAESAVSGNSLATAFIKGGSLSCCLRCAARACSTSCRGRSCRRSRSRCKARIRRRPNARCTRPRRRSRHEPATRSCCASRATDRASC